MICNSWWYAWICIAISGLHNSSPSPIYIRLLCLCPTESRHICTCPRFYNGPDIIPREAIPTPLKCDGSMVRSDPNNAAPNVCHDNDYWKSCGIRRISRWYLPSFIRACQWVGIVIMAPSNEKKICIAGPLWGESTGTGGFPSQRQVTQNFEVFFYSRLKKRLSKQSGRRWSEAIPSVVGELGQDGRHQAIIWTNAELYNYCQLDPKQHISMKFYLKFKYFNFRKCIWTWTCRLWNDGHFVGGGGKWNK